MIAQGVRTSLLGHLLSCKAHFRCHLQNVAFCDDSLTPPSFVSVLSLLKLSFLSLATFLFSISPIFLHRFFLELIEMQRIVQLWVKLRKKWDSSALTSRGKGE